MRGRFCTTPAYTPGFLTSRPASTSASFLISAAASRWAYFSGSAALVRRREPFVPLHGNGTAADPGEVGPALIGVVDIPTETGGLKSQLRYIMAEKTSGWYEWNPKRREYEAK